MERYFDLAPCIFFVASDDGRLLKTNQYLLDCLRYQPDQLEGGKLDLLFPVATRIFYQTHVFPLLKLTGKAKEIYMDLRKSNSETVPVLLNVTRREQDGSILILFSGMVVYNRKKFEEELIAARKDAENALKQNTALQRIKADLQNHAEELEQQMRVVSMRNEELRQFNRIVTHDMQEPLRKLTVFTNMMQTELQHSGESKLLEKIIRVTQQLKTVLSGLQQYVWLTDSPLTASTVALKGVLENVQKQLAQSYPDVQLQLEQKDLPAVLADRRQMELLFSELLSNAVRFRKEPGLASVCISADTIQLNKFKNVKTTYHWAECLRLRIEDKGIGFAPEYKAKVFELFRRLDERSGRGIGLALCKQVVENHQGTISIDSTPGVGTVVTIILPLNTESNGTKPEVENEIVNLQQKQ